MRLPSTVARELYWTSQRLRGRAAVRARLAWLEETQRRSAAEIAKLQAGKLRDTIEHAWRTVPYYRRVFDERGLTPADIEGPADLGKLPVLSRDLLIRHQGELVSSEADHATLQTNYSSGSTGRRAEFKQDLDFRLWMRAHQLRTYQWCAGWRLGDPFVLLWGSEIYWRFKEFVDRFENVLMNRREFNTFRLSQQLVERFLDELIAFRPALISTYSNAMHLIAREAERRGVRIPELRAIQGTSEPMPPEFRARIAETFGCAIYDKYGMRETNIISHESPAHDGMCVQAENVVVEFVRPDGSPCDEGEDGRLVVTTLNNRSMPLIRYESSDVAHRLPTPPTGNQMPRMSHVAGRLQDLIMTPAGDRIDAYFFSYLIMRFDEIHWFQIVQREVDRLILRVFAPGGLSKQTTAALEERIHHHTGFPFALEFDRLAEMPPSSTGKFRLCVSELPDELQARAATER